MYSFLLGPVSWWFQLLRDNCSENKDEKLKLEKEKKKLSNALAGNWTRASRAGENSTTEPPMPSRSMWFWKRNRSLQGLRFFCFSSIIRLMMEEKQKKRNPCKLRFLFQNHIEREGIGGSVVEFSPATREARVQFPANAFESFFFSFFLIFRLCFHCSCLVAVETTRILVLARVHKFFMHSWS